MNRIEEMEICRIYKESKYQKLQERILADMYLCKVEDIRELLVRNGVYNPNGREKAHPWNRGTNGYKRNRRVAG